MRSVMSHRFSEVPQAEIQRSSFDRSHGYKTTFDSGYLIPVYVDEALPGDTFHLRMSAFARMATLLKVPMDNVFLDSFFFSVPIRLIWDNWKRFNGEQSNPGDTTSYSVPYIVGPAGGGMGVGSLADYMGIPVQVNSVQFNSLHFRAYALIWNEWFRDQNLQNATHLDTGDGPDTYANYPLLKRGKRHDYFTSCLPWPQKGADVTLPLGSIAPVVTTGSNFKLTNVPGGTEQTLRGVSAARTVEGGTGNWDSTNALQFGSVTGLQADLSTATAATINALRQAFQLQRMYERDARGGTRYIEIVKSHFGVTSPDLRATRPEYLGGGSTPINFHVVAGTNQVGAGTTNQGNLSSFGTGAISGHGFTKSFTEHCVLIGMVSVRADLTYQQGLHRMFSRRTRFDYYWPALSHLGEQAVLRKEIFTDGTANDNIVFGYQERYAEYRYKPSQITGRFRSAYATPLDMWHLSQYFTIPPTLGDTFIKETPPIDRVVAVNTEPQFLFDSYFDLKCARPMPVYSVPGLIDHF